MGTHKSDAILEPNKGISYCYPVPKLSANVDPTLLEYKIARPDIVATLWLMKNKEGKHAHGSHVPSSSLAPR
jgi:hypothetical protein